MYVVNKARKSRMEKGNYRWLYDHYDYPADALPESPPHQPACAISKSKALLRHSMRSVNRNR